MFKKKYLAWNEYKRLVENRQKLFFISNTTMRSINNFYRKMEMEVVCNG